MTSRSCLHLFVFCATPKAEAGLTQVQAQPEEGPDLSMLKLKELSDERAAKWPDTLQVCLCFAAHSERPRKLWYFAPAIIL